MNGTKSLYFEIFIEQHSQTCIEYGIMLGKTVLNALFFHKSRLGGSFQMVSNRYNKVIRIFYEIPGSADYDL